MSLRACLRWMLLVAVLLPLAACVGTRVTNLSRGSAPVPIEALLIVYRPTSFGSSYSSAGSLGRRNLAELVPHLRARLPALLQEQGIRTRMVSEPELEHVRLEPGEKLLWIAAASAAYSTRSGQTLTMNAEILDPATRVSLWKGEIVMTTLGFGSFDDKVVDNLGEQLVRQLRQARMLPGQRAPATPQRSDPLPTLQAQPQPQPQPQPRVAAAPQAIPAPRDFPAPTTFPLPPQILPPQVLPPQIPPPHAPVAGSAPSAPASPLPRLASGFARIDDIDAIPYLSDRGREAYRNWLNLPTPRAFAIAPNGTFSFTSGLRPPQANDPSDPTDRALAVCERSARLPCKLYAVNGAVVWVK
jgi:hypothetical protein